MSRESALDSPVLLIGATGLVGGFVLRRLASMRVDVFALSRVRHESAPGVDWIMADLDALDFNQLPAIPVAISLANIWLLPPALPALRSAGVRRLVAISSTSRFTKMTSTVPSEREVVRLLADAEARVETYCAEHHIDWTILRPTIIYAEGLDRSITRIASVIKRFRVFPLSGRGEGMRQPVHADDLAAGVIAAAASPLARNRAYDMPGGETLTYRAMCERIFEGMGRRPRIVAVPPALWQVAFAIAGRFVAGATSAMGSRMDDDMTFDGSAARNDFGWMPRDFHPEFLGA